MVRQLTKETFKQWHSIETCYTWFEYKQSQYQIRVHSERLKEYLEKRKIIAEGKIIHKTTRNKEEKITEGKDRNSFCYFK